jgi:hypothetical protein
MPRPEAAANAQSAFFSPWPATVDTAAHTVQLAILGSGTYQVVALAEPLLVYEEEALEPEQLQAAALDEALQPTDPQIFQLVFVDTPEDSEALKNEIVDALRSTWRTLVLRKDFEAKASRVTVMVQRIADCGQAHVPATIVVFPAGSCHLPATLAHEYFHLIQHWYSNNASGAEPAASDNNWFTEGSAEWAADEVFDSVAGHYHTPDGYRFHDSLNISVATGNLKSYQTVVFWKWLEAQAPGSIRLIMEDHRSLTQIMPGASSYVFAHLVPAYYLDSLKAVHADLDFLSFATAALYWKNFESDEIGFGNLWGENSLGPPKDVPPTFRKSAQGDDLVNRLMQNGVGDGADRAHKVDGVLPAYLTANAWVYANTEDGPGLSGTFHVKFKPQDAGDPVLKAAVIAHDTGKEQRVEKLSAGGEVTVSVPFGPGSEVIVIPTVTEWKPPTLDPTPVKFEAWVEPCGGVVKAGTEVNSVEALIQAVLNARPGDTVRLAQGTYTIPSIKWDAAGQPTTDPNGNPASVLINKELTLAGSGRGETTIILPDQDAALWAYGEAAAVTFRDFRVVANGGFGFYAPRARRISLCNIVAEFGPTTSWGLGFGPLHGGGRLEVQGTTFDCSRCHSSLEKWGFYVHFGGDYLAEPNANIDVQIHNSAISGWDLGLHFCTTPSCGNVQLHVDCDSFFENRYGNVWDATPPGVEHCPADGGDP